MANRNQLTNLLLIAVLFAAAAPAVSTAADAAPAAVTVDALPADADAARQAQKLIDKGTAFLVSRQQPDGFWAGDKAPLGLNALVLKALAQSPAYGYSHPAVRRGFDKLIAAQLQSGGIYKDTLACYNTAIAISALAAADNKDLRPAIDKAVNYLKGLQWTDAIAGPKGETIDPGNPWYGGFGYGGTSRGSGRPDLSNSQMALDALHDSGLKADDLAYQAALKFVTRLQNSSETNDQAWAGDDGGFVYGPSDDGKGESFAGEYTDANGRRLLRSYGAMTYAGIKSMIYAGLSKNDPRVKAGWTWITNNWTLDENPGIKAGNAGNSGYALYYYYHTLAKTLRAYNQPVITDSQGVRHDWRVELITKLTALQHEDGSWAGEQKWMEDNPVLTTAYVVLALQEAQSSLSEK